MPKSTIPSPDSSPSAVDLAYQRVLEALPVPRIARVVASLDLLRLFAEREYRPVVCDVCHAELVVSKRQLAKDKNDGDDPEDQAEALQWVHDHRQQQCVVARPPDSTPDPDARSYEEGRRAAGRHILSVALEMLADDPEIGSSALLLKELEDTRVVLRRLCADFGDNDWEDELYLADALDKHLGDYLC